MSESTIRIILIACAILVFAAVLYQMVIYDMDRRKRESVERQLISEHFVRYFKTVPFWDNVPNYVLINCDLIKTKRPYLYKRAIELKVIDPGYNYFWIPKEDTLWSMK